MKIFSETTTVFAFTKDIITTAAAEKPIPENAAADLSSESRVFYEKGIIYHPNGAVVLSQCPEEYALFNGHMLHIQQNGRDFVFDLRLKQRDLLTIMEKLVKNTDEKDISPLLFDYLQTAAEIIKGTALSRKDTLLSFIRN